MSQTPDIRKRLDELEQRVRMLERRMAFRGLTERSEPEPEAPVAPVMQSVFVEPSPPAPAPESAPVTTPEAVPMTPPALPPLPVFAPERPRPAPKSAFDIERTIGTRWFAAAGAVVVVIGVGLFLKLAYERGWLSLIPPAGKCFSGAVFGLALLGAGEFIRRRVGAIASAGVSAAGLGALFASSYAAYGVYHLMPSGVAFALLAAVAALGFFIAAVGNLVSIGVLSIVAAYVNPFIIGDPTAGPLILPAYLLAILCTGLALSAWRAFPFRPLRSLAWWGTLILGTAWCRDQGLAHPSAALTFLAAAWCAIHSELAIASRFPVFGAPATRFTGELVWNRARFIATSFSTTAWAAALGVLTARQGASLADWWPPATLALLAAALAIRLAGNLRILRDIPRSDSERLGAGLAMQTGALLMTAVALAFSGWLEVIAWLSLGLAAVATGRWIRSRGLDIYGLVALAIASLRLVAYDSPILTAQPWSYDLGGIIITRWAILMAAGAATWVIASRLIRPGSKPQLWRGVAVGALIVALAHLNLSLVHENADATSVCLVWLLLGIAGLLLGRSMRATPLTVYGVIVLIAACFRFMVASPLTGAASTVLASGAGLVITRWTVLMLAGATAWFIGAALLRDREPTPGIDPVKPGLRNQAALVGIGLAMLYLGLVHPQAQAASVMYAWIVLSAMVIGVHSLFRRVALDMFGLFGFVLAAAAWITAFPIDWMKSNSPCALHPGLIASLALGGAALACLSWLRNPANPARPTEEAVTRAVVPAVAVLLFASTSLEVARVAGIVASDPAARRAAVSIWWGIVGVALIVTGFWRVTPAARHAGLGLMAVATVKAIAFDLASVPQVWRVASFVGLGLLMLAVAVGYARVSARLARAS